MLGISLDSYNKAAYVSEIVPEDTPCKTRES
jgi:hypothetical protein